MPNGFETAIALHEIVEAEPGGPADSAAVGAATAEFFHDGDLPVVQEEIAIGQEAGGALGAGVDVVVWIGEVIE